MFRIEGDGSWQHTKIWKDEVLIERWNKCTIRIDEGGSVVEVDEDIGSLSRVVLLGIYKMIGDGEFSNTKVFINDEPLRGIQSVVVKIEKGEDPRIGIRAVFLPNLVEENEDV